MRLLIELGYQKLLLPESADTSAILSALCGADAVEEKSDSYSTPSRYVIKQDANNITAPIFVHERQVIDEETGAVMETKSLKASNAKLHTERYEAKKKPKELEEKIWGKRKNQ